MAFKVISGGQTGVDRLGLEVAKALGIATGGWAAKGFRTENGFDPSLAEFGLREHSRSDYSGRTEQNVKDADLTVLFGDLKSAGSKQTIGFCQKHTKSFVCNPVAELLKECIAYGNVQTLNVAGNRGSKLDAEQLKQFANILSEALYDKANQ